MFLICIIINIEHRVLVEIIIKNKIQNFIHSNLLIDLFYYINFLYQAIIFRNRTFTQPYVYRKNIFYINTVVRMNLTCYIELKFERQFFFPRNQVLKEPFKLQ